MDKFLFISDGLLPMIIFYIVGLAVSKKLPVFDIFIRGAGNGIKTTIEILPTLVGMFIGIGILQKSGFLLLLSKIMSWVFGCFGIGEGLVPGALWPVILTRPLSASAASGLVLNIFENYGPDSYIGLAASLILSCSETVFYTVSVYFGSVRITKTKHTITGALIATAAGIIASIILAAAMQN